VVVLSFSRLVTLPENEEWVVKPMAIEMIEQRKFGEWILLLVSKSSLNGPSSSKRSLHAGASEKWPCLLLEHCRPGAFSSLLVVSLSEATETTLTFDR